MINIFIKSKIDKFSKYHFVKNLNKNSKLLDVGCGNHSATKINFMNKNLSIDGIDILDYNINELDKKNMSNYYIVDKDKFNQFIFDLPQSYDAIICSHVIEHVSNYTELLTVLLKKLNKNGQLYLSFPNQNSVNFPHRKGTLNFYDDLTHVDLPNVNTIKTLFQENNCIIIEEANPNKVPFGYVIGMLVEPISVLLKRILPFTWYFWGFENVFIVQKK